MNFIIKFIGVNQMHNGDRSPIVVKIGSECLFDIVENSLKVHDDFFLKKAREMRHMYDNGLYPILVTSGAISLGLDKTDNDLSSRTTETNDPYLSALAAIGQPILQYKWGEAFETTGLKVAQGLLHKPSLDNNQYLKQVLMEISGLDAVPILNENDFLYKEELHGDNDRASQMIADVVDAKLLLFQVAKPNGFYDLDGQVIPHIENIGDDHYQLCGKPSMLGSGTGMAGKLRVIEDANKRGTTVILSNKNSDLYEIIKLDYQGLRTIFGETERLL